MNNREKKILKKLYKIQGKIFPCGDYPNKRNKLWNECFNELGGKELIWYNTIDGSTHCKYVNKILNGEYYKMNLNNFEYLKNEIKNNIEKNHIKQSNNDIFALRAVENDGVFKIIPSDHPGHPGYAVVVIMDSELLNKNNFN